MILYSIKSYLVNTRKKEYHDEILREKENEKIPLVSCCSITGITAMGRARVTSTLLSINSILSIPKAHLRIIYLLLILLFFSHYVFHKITLILIWIFCF